MFTIPAIRRMMVVQVRCTRRHPNAELGRTEYETPHFCSSDCRANLPHPGGGSTASGTSSEGARAAGEKLCPAGRAQRTPLDRGRCNAPAP